jgi:hypothetical protein
MVEFSTSLKTFSVEIKNDYSYIEKEVIFLTGCIVSSNEDSNEKRSKSFDEAEGNEIV